MFIHMVCNKNIIPNNTVPIFTTLVLHITIITTHHIRHSVMS